MRTFGLLTLALGALAGCRSAAPVTEEPHHRVAFENAEFRILDVNVPPGESTAEHTHSHDIVTVSMNAGTETRVDGEVRPPRPLGDVQVAEYAGSPGTHRVENVGTTPYQLFAIENLRTEGWSTGPPVSGPGTTTVSDNRAFRVYDVTLVGDRHHASHEHTSPTLVLLVTGRVFSEGAEVEGQEPAVPSGVKQLDAPGQWVFIPAGMPHFLIRLGLDPARVVEVELR